MIARVNDAVKYVNDALEKYDLALAGQRVYELIWNEYCDWYIELVKGRLYGDDEEDKKAARYVLVRTLTDMLKMLHPFMPFITEEIWSFLPRLEADKKAENPHDFLMKADWPLYDEKLTFEDDVKTLETAMNAIRSIRNIRAEAETAPGKKLRAVVVAEGEALARIKKGESYIKSLANIESITFAQRRDEAPDDVMSAVIDGAEILIPLDELVDYKAEFERLTKEKARLENEVKRVQGMLSNPGFVNKAPAAKIEEEKEKMVKYKDMLEKVTSRIALISKKL